MLLGLLAAGTVVAPQEPAPNSRFTVIVFDASGASVPALRELAEAGNARFLATDSAHVLSDLLTGAVTGTLPGQGMPGVLPDPSGPGYAGWLLAALGLLATLSLWAVWKGGSRPLTFMRAGGTTLEVRLRDPEGRIADLRVGPRWTTIGRAPACDVTVADPTLSRRHLRVATRRGQLVVEDLGSTNGLQVNDLPVKQAEVGLSDVVTLGRTRLTRKG